VAGRPVRSRLIRTKMVHALLLPSATAKAIRRRLRGPLGGLHDGMRLISHASVGEQRDGEAGAGAATFDPGWWSFPAAAGGASTLDARCRDHRRGTADAGTAMPGATDAGGADAGAPMPGPPTPGGRLTRGHRAGAADARCTSRMPDAATASPHQRTAAAPDAGIASRAAASGTWILAAARLLAWRRDAGWLALLATLALGYRRLAERTGGSLRLWPVRA